MQTKAQKRKIKLAGRVKCHGTTESCIGLVNLGQHRPLGKLTKKGTKPKAKVKKVYKKPFNKD